MNLSMSLQQVFDWLVTFINFGIMFLLFRLVVIIPMQEAVKLRGQRVALRFKEIGELADDAAEKKKTFEEKFSKLDDVVAEVKKNAERSQNQARTKIEEKAAAEERYMIEKATAEAEALIRETEEEIRTEIAGLAVQRAEEILNDVLDATAQNKIVSTSIEKVGELSAS